VGEVEVAAGADIAQNEDELLRAFTALDASRMHFAILGDWLVDAHVLTRRSEDKRFLQRLFNLTDSSRFVFRPSQEV